MVDALASEYGWQPDLSLDLPVDVVAQLCHAILHRKGVRVFRSISEASTDEQPLAARLEGIWGKVDKE
jgi:hypothetical protein